MLVLYSAPALAGGSPVIITGEKAAPAEISAAADLAKDIERVCGVKAEIKQLSAKQKAGRIPAKTQIVIGTPASNSLISKAASKKTIVVTDKNPGPEAFILKTAKNYPSRGVTTLFIAGSDARGAMYGAYEFSNRVLGVDPYEYWTGKTPKPQKGLRIPPLDFREKPPVFPLRGYFDNDDDMIANWKGKKLIIEFDTWKEMIDSLARLRYNYIDLHDTLGRAEFWNWDYYKKMADYHTDLELVGKIIDYAHSKGMLVQVPMYLGWEFHHLPYEKLCLSKYHGDWMDVYEYYLTKSPLGKADMFLQRPRDPWKDIGYKCAEETAAGIDPGPLMNDMFNGLNALVKKYRPGGKVVCDLWAEGREMWRKGTFDPDKDIDMMWADAGYATYSEWPSDYKGHDFGIYIHAGYFLNHVMQDPYPDLIAESTREAVRRGMTDNYFVNGQDFKHFILNLEAAARASWSPDTFDPEAFYLEWTGRYFGEQAAPEIVRSLKALHRSHVLAGGGFARMMSWTESILNSLVVMAAQKQDVSKMPAALSAAEESYQLALKAKELVPSDKQLVYDDQILFPAKIFLEDMRLYIAVAETANNFIDGRDSALSPDQRRAARDRLKETKPLVIQRLKSLRAMLEQGSSWKKWDGWTKPENFRKITPPPDVDFTEKVLRPLK